MQYRMVLADGETYTDLAGCVIVAIPDDVDIDDISEGVEDGTATEVVIFGPTPADTELLVDLDEDSDI